MSVSIHGRDLDGGKLVSIVAVLGLAAGLIAAAATYWLRDGFNEDEFFQLAFVNESMPQFFALFLRLDQHPPFHFLQLIPWHWISDSDGWMLANSLVWHLVSCGVILYVGRSWLGASAGWLAAALYALTPQAVSAATTLRFYAMIPALAVLAWWLHVRCLSNDRSSAWRWWALAGVQLALTYSHAIAFYFVFWIALAAVAQQWQILGRSAPWRRWLAVQFAVFLLLMPQVLLTAARALMARGAGDVIGGNNDPGGLIDHFGGMTAGWGMQWYAARVGGALLFGAALVLGLWRERTRWLSGVMLVGPYALAIVIGALLTPMFKTPVYSSMLVPFACLVLAGALVQFPTRWQTLAAGSLLAGLALFIFPAAAHLNRSVSPYRPLVAELQRKARPGDIVVVAKPYLYWAVLRYAVAPDWGSPLEVLPALNESWRRLNERIGPAAVRALKLTPRTQQLVHGDITYVIGDEATAPSAAARRVWVVERVAYPSPVKLAEGFADRGVVYRAGMPEATELRLFERPHPPDR